MLPRWNLAGRIVSLYGVAIVVNEGAVEKCLKANHSQSLLTLAFGPGIALLLSPIPLHGTEKLYEIIEPE
jgi:hypothetical protein